MTNVSRSCMIFFLVALMMLQPLTSIDYDLEAFNIKLSSQNDSSYQKLIN